MTTNNHPALVSVNLPGTNVEDPFAAIILAGRVDHSGQIVAMGRTSLFFSDVDVRAEFRLWGGSTKRSMAAISGRGPALEAKPSGRVVAVGRSEHLGQHIVHDVMSVDDQGRVYGGTIPIR